MCSLCGATVVPERVETLTHEAFNQEVWEREEEAKGPLPPFKGVLKICLTVQDDVSGVKTIRRPSRRTLTPIGTKAVFRMGTGIPRSLGYPYRRRLGAVSVSASVTGLVSASVSSGTTVAPQRLQAYVVSMLSSEATSRTLRGILRGIHGGALRG